MMRNSLYPNLLDTVAKNYAKGFDAFSLFEIGDIFKDPVGFNQQKSVGIIISGFQTKKIGTMIGDILISLI